MKQHTHQPSVLESTQASSYGVNIVTVAGGAELPETKIEDKCLNTYLEIFTALSVLDRRTNVTACRRCTSKQCNVAFTHQASARDTRPNLKLFPRDLLQPTVDDCLINDCTNGPFKPTIINLQNSAQPTFQSH
jgi:hypothetical protein